MAGFRKRRRERGNDGGAPTARERGKMRRRLRRQQRVREALLLDLGALVFELHRQGRREPELLQAKAAELSEVDQEVRVLAEALDEDRSAQQLVAAGITGSCERCGALLTLDARYCSACGAATSLSLPGEPSAPEGDGKGIEEHAPAPWHEDRASLGAAPSGEPAAEEPPAQAASVPRGPPPVPGGPPPVPGGPPVEQPGAEAPSEEEPPGPEESPVEEPPVEEPPVEEPPVEEPPVEEPPVEEPPVEEPPVEEPPVEGPPVEEPPVEEPPVEADEAPVVTEPPWRRTRDAEVAGPTFEAGAREGVPPVGSRPGPTPAEPVADRALRLMRLGLRRGRKWVQSRRSGDA